MTNEEYRDAVAKKMGWVNREWKETIDTSSFGDESGDESFPEPIIRGMFS